MLRKMNIPPGIFKGYDLRGIYPDEFNEENIVPIIKAIYKYFQDSFKKKQLAVGLGKDMRISTPALFEVASQTLVDLGADITDLDLVSTPTFYFAIFKYKYDIGIQITASHNPKEYNGIKIIKNAPNGLIKIGKTMGLDDIKKMSLEGVGAIKSEGGSITKKGGVVEEEVDSAIDVIGNPEIKEFKIVADPANAMGSLYIDALFKKVPGNLIRMNFELDGNFPAHQPDPLQPDNLIPLQKRVIEEKADLGLAPDGDGDRLFFVDENGDVVPPSVITALVARELLKKYKGEKILADIRYVMTPKKVTEQEGGQFIMTRVGHAYITESLNETGGLFAGESSAHYYFRHTGGAESQIPVILIVLATMTREGKKLSEITKELQFSRESGEINFKVKNANEIMEKIKEKYSDGEVNTMDGVAVSYSDWRFSLRSSNTEPLLRLNVEQSDIETTVKREEELIKLIEEYGDFEEEN